MVRFEILTSMKMAVFWDVASIMETVTYLL
jgi:hypothetical protein